MYDWLKSKWLLSDADYNCYGRCYRETDTEGNYMPKVYKGGRIEYDDLVYNDKVTVTSFFDVDETEKYSP